MVLRFYCVNGTLVVADCALELKTNQLSSLAER